MVISTIVVFWGPTGICLSFCLLPEAFSYQRSWQAMPYCNAVFSSQARSKTLACQEIWGARVGVLVFMYPQKLTGDLQTSL